MCGYRVCRSSLLLDDRFFLCVVVVHFHHLLLTDRIAHLSCLLFLIHIFIFLRLSRLRYFNCQASVDGHLLLDLLDHTRLVFGCLQSCIIRYALLVCIIHYYFMHYVLYIILYANRLPHLLLIHYILFS